MLWPLIFALVIVIFAWRPLYEDSFGFLEYLLSTMFLAMLAIAGLVAGIAVALIVGAAVPKHWTEGETIKLVSLRSGDSVSGSFFLGTGSIGTTQYYFYYKEAGRGYQPGRVEVADNVTIFEEKRQAGELKVYTSKFVNPSLEWVALNVEHHKYEFIIPEGSLKKNFVLQ